MQPTALVLLWQQDSGSSHCLRTLPDGIRLSYHLPLRLQPVYAWQQSQGAAMHTQPLAVVLPDCEGYYQQKQLKAAVKSLAFNFPAPFQKSRGATWDWCKPFSCPSRTALGDTGHLSLIFLHPICLCLCLGFPSISSKIAYKSLSNFTVDFNHLNKHASFVQKIYSSVYMHSQEWVKKQPDHTIFLIMQVVEQHRKVKSLPLHYFHYLSG